MVTRPQEQQKGNVRAREAKGGARDKRRFAPQEFEQKLLDLARVARVTKGGRRFSFRATVVIGDHKGRVGVGVAKGKDVALAVEKAVKNAKKDLVIVPMTPEGTIPYEAEGKQTSSRVLLMPAKKGRGIIAGGPVRVICDLAGFSDIVGKIIGRTKNKLNNAVATIEALKSIRYAAPSPNKGEEIVEKKEINTVKT